MKLEKIEIEAPVFSPDEWDSLRETEEGEIAQKNVLEANKRLTQYHYYLDHFKEFLDARQRLTREGGQDIK